MINSAVICGPELCKRDGIMKTRLITDNDGYSLRLVLLFELAYSDGADLILSYRNTNKDSGPDFSVFSVFQAKGRYEGKNCRKKMSIFSCS